jgi:hypothetical protein
MFETAITLGILLGSMLMFGYWFRYTCLLILSARTAKDYTAAAARANGLSFPEVQQQLQAAGFVELDRLQASLNADYARVSELLGAREDASLEDRMLLLHYSAAQVLFKVTRPLAPAAARGALTEMAAVVSHFANALGEKAVAAGA